VVFITLQNFVGIDAELSILYKTRMWANAQRDDRPAKHRWHPLFNAAKFGWRPLLECRAVKAHSHRARLRPSVVCTRQH